MAVHRGSNSRLIEIRFAADDGLECGSEFLHALDLMTTPFAPERGLPSETCFQQFEHYCEMSSVCARMASVFRDCDFPGITKLKPSRTVVETDAITGRPVIRTCFDAFSDEYL